MVSNPDVRVAVAPLSAANVVTTLSAAVDSTFRTIRKLPFETPLVAEVPEPHLLSTAIPGGSAAIASIHTGSPTRLTTSSSVQPSAGTLLLSVLDRTQEDVTVASVTGSGPYTVMLSAGVVSAHAANERGGVR